MDSQEESEEKMEEGVKVAALAKVKKVTRRKSAIQKINAKLRNKWVLLINCLNFLNTNINSELINIIK